MSAETNILTGIAKLGGVDRIGALEENDSTAMLISSGKSLVKYRDGTEKMQMGILLHGRSGDQKALMDLMGGICDKVCGGAKKLTFDDRTRILKAEIGTAPAPLSIDMSGRYFYKAVLMITYIKFKEDKIHESK